MYLEVSLDLKVRNLSAILDNIFDRSGSTSGMSKFACKITS